MTCNRDGTTVLAVVLLFALGAAVPAQISANSFDPNANDCVRTILIQPDGKIIVGGEFTQLGGTNRSCIGRFSTNGSLDLAFNPGASGKDFPISVNTLALQKDGKILVGGNFTNLAGQSHNCIGRLNADGTLDSGFNPVGVYTIIYALAEQADGKILVGGLFTSLCGQPRSNIGRLLADGSLDWSFNPGADNTVDSLVVQTNGTFLVGGSFTTLAGELHHCVGRLYTSGAADSGFVPGADFSYYPGVYSLVPQGNGKILTAGRFTTLNGTNRNYIGRFNADGTLDDNFNPNVGYMINALTMQTDGKILIGGVFNSVGGQEHTLIARLNADGTVDNTFNCTVSGGSPAYVSTLAVQADGKILLGGVFTNVAGQRRNNIARLNADGTLDSPPHLAGLKRQNNGAFRFSFTNTTGASFTALASTNAELPLTNWIILGSVPQLSPGYFEFSDLQASNSALRFYRVRSP